ncbi:MAG: hypothetical protein ACI4P4_12330 [Faecousia sp.]
MAKQRHSRFYHRYFENYAEKEIPAPGGGYTIQRVYVGKYYRVNLTDQQLRRQKIIILILALLTLAGYGAGALMARVSSVSVVAIATMPPLIAGIYLAIAVFYRLTVPREMEIRAYRDSSENLMIRSLAMMICTAVCFAATLAGSLLVPGYSLAETLPALACYLVSLLAGWKLRQTESNTPYLTLDPRQERPEASSPIRFEMQE